MRMLMAMVHESQRYVTGTVTVKLYKGTAMPVARESPCSLYDAPRASMDEHGGFNQQDSAGFIRINAVRLVASAQRDGAYDSEENIMLIREAGARAAERARKGR